MLDDWQHIELAYPWVLAGLIIIPFIIYWYVRNNLKKRAAISITTTKYLTGLREPGQSLFHIPFVLRCVALGALIIALARPRHSFEEEIVQGEGIDIMLCLDVSGTMAYQDFLPNRLEASKELAKDFVRSRYGDRIGIVLFSSHGFTMCPLTTDTSEVLMQINNVTDSILSNEGTVIGTGIATCVNRLKDSKSKNRIIILLSDGVNSPEAVSPDTAIKLATVFNIKVYAIGIGSDNEVDVVKHTPFGDIPGKEKSEFNEPLLRKIAMETGGEYYHALNKEGLKIGFENIHSLEKSMIEKVSYKTYTDKYLLFLIAGFLLLFLEVILRYSVFKKFP